MYDTLIIRTDYQGHAAVVTAVGDVDIYTASKLRQRIIDLVAAGQTRIVLDLDRCPFIDATGLGVLYGALKRVRLAKGCLAVVATGANVVRALRVTGLDRAIPVCGTVPAAIAALRPGETS